MKIKQLISALIFVISPSLFLHGIKSLEDVLEQTEKLLERAIDFAGNNEVVFHNIVNDLNSFKKNVGILDSKTLRNDSDKLRKMTPQVLATMRREDLNFYLSCLTWHCITYLVHAKHWLTSQSSSPDITENYINYSMSASPFSDDKLLEKANNQLVNLYRKSSHEYRVVINHLALPMSASLLSSLFLQSNL